MLELEIIKNCAATLAGIKTGNLFNYKVDDEQKLQMELREVNEMINAKGVFAKCLTWKENHALIYVYRESSLKKDLESEEVRKLLSGYGYRCFSVDAAMEHLVERLSGYECFPHEIGLFLGYPAADVAGFIRNGGRDCKCCGLWKVYCNEKEAVRMFEKIEKCSRVYSQVFAQGRSIRQMTVTA